MSSTSDMAFAPNVQEIVTDPSQIPENFLIIRNEEKGKANNTADTCHLSSEIPIVDLSLLSRGHKDELNKLDQACNEWGFFQVSGNRSVAEMKDATAKFFELPLEEKNKIRMPLDDFQGYGEAYAACQGQTVNSIAELEKRAGASCIAELESVRVLSCKC